MHSRAFWSVVVACAPAAARAQLPADGTPTAPLSGSRFLPPYPAPGLPNGGYPYGYSRPFGTSGVAAFGFYVPRGFWPNGLSLYGPPVPTPGAMPGVFGNYDLARTWQAVPFSGVGPYGAIGVYAPLSRPRVPLGPTPPVTEWLAPGPTAPLPRGAKLGGSITISVKVSQPFAEVFVNGKRTAQTGTERTFESPPLEDGQNYQYTVTARWVENGQTVEVSKTATGAPGAVVVVDFGAPAVATGK